jgi:hypothetical protein
LHRRFNPKNHDRLSTKNKQRSPLTTQNHDLPIKKIKQRSPLNPKITIATPKKSNSDRPAQHPKHHDRLHKNQIVKALQDKMSVQGFNSDLNLSMKNFP